VNLQQNCNKIAHLSWRLFSPYFVKRNIHVASQQTRPQFCRLQDMEIWTVIQECIYQKQQGTSNTVDVLWLLTEW